MTLRTHILAASDYSLVTELFNVTGGLITTNNGLPPWIPFRPYMPPKWEAESYRSFRLCQRAVKAFLTGRSTGLDARMQNTKIDPSEPTTRC